VFGVDFGRSAGERLYASLATRGLRYTSAIITARSTISNSNSNAVYIRHYNEHRPHRSLDQRPPIEEPPPGSETNVDLDHVRRRDLLGGLIHEYKAAA